MPLTHEITQKLNGILSSHNIFTDPADCWSYGYDNSRIHHCPDAVVFVNNEQQVQAIVKLAYENNLAIVPRGLGSGTTGGSVPIHGGIVLSFERMNRILSVDAANRVIIVEPGVTNAAIQNAAKEQQLFFAPDPSSAAFCTIGGNLAYNSAGPRAVKYGTTRENTLGLRAITGEGKLIKTGVYTSKGVMGYDLTRLLIGSEATLAIITQATLKLLPLPDTKRTLRVIFDSIHQATECVTRLMGQAIIPCALEFMDHNALNLVRDMASDPIPATANALLMIEIDGSHATVDNDLDQIINLCQQEGCLDIKTASSQTEIKQLWQMRKSLSPALRNIAPKKINEDIVIPISTIPHFIDTVTQYSQEYSITIVCFGHAGNGNIHVNLMFDPEDEQQNNNAQRCLERIFRLVIELNGTLSGEHGIGLAKKPYVHYELDENTLELMARIKQQFDPKGILNPGK